MKITQLLKAERYNARLIAGDVWLVWDSTRSKWVVYERKRYQRHTREIISTPDEELAVLAFRDTALEDK